MEANFSNTPDTPIQPYQLNGGLNQQWYLNPAAQGFNIINASSNLFLDDPGGLASGFVSSQDQELVRRRPEPAMAIVIGLVLGLLA